MENTVEVLANKERALEGAIADYLGRRDRGEPVQVEELISAHPGCEADLRGFLEKEHRLQAFATSSGISPKQVGQSLGDFRLIRELGRGGMGVVYEAEQLSLGRRVALKVLPFATMLDKQQLARFKNEARAAATLDHPNIVAVHFVGCEGDVHYYAMQLIAGRSLAQVIAALRHANYLGSADLSEQLANKSTDDQFLSTILSQADKQPRHDEFAPAATPVESTHSPPLLEYASREYFRAVARLGQEAASALDYAHQSGVLHRDIKPANLLLDEAGKLWIADFGLARLESDASLTGTGDMLGTLRYMAPEQAQAQRAVTDHRCDIYSLGATLYELLTLRPAFPETDPARLLQQIVHDEPQVPCKLNGRVPHALETIVLKAMRKSADERYATAQALADDLGNFLEDRPIQAKRPTPLAMMRHWSRRHQAVVWASVATLLLSGLVLAASVGWTTRDRAARQAVVDTTANIAIEEAKGLVEQRRWSQALAAVKRAEDVLMGRKEGPLVGEAAALRKDIEMVVRLDQIPDADRLMLHNTIIREHYDKLYLEYFREYGVDVEALDTTTAADRIRRSHVSLQLAHELDKWATMRRRWANPSPPGKPLLDIARIVDPEPIRNRIRDALLAGTTEARKQAFDELSVSLDKESLPLRTMLLLAHTVNRMGTREQAIDLIRAIQHQVPGEFELNLDLGYELLHASPPRSEEALQFYRAAAALRPDDSQAREELGFVLNRVGLLDDAIAELSEAIRLKPNSSSAHTNLGVAYSNGGLKDQAIEAFREAIRVNSGDPLVYHNPVVPYHNLGVVLQEVGRIDEAIAAFREAVRLNPNSAEDHASLGILLQNQGLFDQAIPEYRQAIRLSPNNSAFLHCNLGVALAETGRSDEALNHFQIAVKLDPKDVKNLFNLGMALDQKGLVEEGIAAFRAAAELEPNEAGVHRSLGLALSQAGHLDEAIAAYREAVRIQPGMAEHRKLLSQALYEKGLAEEANVEFQKAITLYREIIQNTPHNSFVLWNLAWMLASCPDSSFRNPQEAVELANKAVELTPHGANGWGTLGIAHYRAGHFGEALEALQKAYQLNDDDVERLMFLAMTEWQLGNHDKAREWYDKANKWMNEHPQVVGGEIALIRAEAEELLGISQPENPEVETADENDLHGK